MEVHGLNLRGQLNLFVVRGWGRGGVGWGVGGRGQNGGGGGGGEEGDGVHFDRC